MNGAQEITTLVTDRSAPRVFTSNQECDARTALMRGLAEYIFTNAKAKIIGGGEQSFEAYFDTWAEAEDEQVWPAFICYAPNSPGQYQASKLSPFPDKGDRLVAQQDVYLVSPSEFMADVVVDVWCTTPEQRAAFCASLENILNPYPTGTNSKNQYGVILQLPHYFNQRASYELLSSKYLDDDASAIKRYRVASFFLSGSLPVSVLRSFKDSRVIIQTKVDGET